MKSLGHIFLGILIACVGFYFIDGCSDGSKQKVKRDTVTEVRTVVDTLRDTITETNWKVKTEYIRHVDTLRDTVEVFNDYFAYRWYERKFSDTNFNATLKAGIWQNRLDSVEFAYDIYNRTKTVTKTVNESYRYKLWLTSSLNFNRANLGAELDFGKHKFGLSRTMLSESELNEGEKWWVRYGVRLVER